MRILNRRERPHTHTPASPQVSTTTENVVCHFYHRNFERCKIVDKHLALLAKKYMETRFIKLSAPVRGRSRLWADCLSCCAVLCCRCASVSLQAAGTVWLFSWLKARLAAPPTHPPSPHHPPTHHHHHHQQDAPFITVKLGIKVLPCVVMFKNGVSVDRVVGFEQLGGKDDFPTVVSVGLGGWRPGWGERGESVMQRV